MSKTESMSAPESITAPESVLCVGIDVGGTKTSIVYRYKGEKASSTVRFLSHGANFHSSGASHISGLVAAVLSRIREEVELNVVICAVAGVAGAGHREILDELNLEFTMARTNHSDRIEAHSDAHIALEGAFSGRAGTIVIAGTGSGVYAKTSSGDRIRAGGWGARLGDSGSGEQIGRRALSAVSRAFDSGEKSSLVDVLRVELEIADRDRMIDTVYDEELKFSTLAPFVLEAAEDGDAMAREIVLSEIHDLAKEAGVVLRQLDTVRVALIGGLCQHSFYRNRLEEALSVEYPDVEITEPDHTPEFGAFRLAETLSNSGD